MAVSYEEKTGNGSTHTYTFTFDYILKDHVKLFYTRDILANTQASTLVSGTDYNWTAAKSIQLVGSTLNSGTTTGQPYNLPSGTKLMIERQTPDSAQISAWQDGSNLTAEALNNADLQNLYVVQENEDILALGSAMSIASKAASDTASNDVAVLTANYFKRDGTLPMTGNLQLGTNKITGVGDPTGAQDVVTKAFLERTGSISSTQILDGTIVNADVNASAAISGSKIQASSGSAAGTMSSANFTKLAGIEASAKDDQTAAEIKTLYESNSDTNEFSDAEQTKLAGIEASATADQTAAEIKSSYESNSNTNAFTDTNKTLVDAITATAAEINHTTNVTSDIQGQLNQKQPLDDELTTLAAMPTGTASVLANSTALTSTTAELNLLDGKSVSTTVSGSSTDTQLPTAKAVNDQIVALLQNIGGFYPIDDELKFPNTNPDPNDDAGTIVSIDDAGGVVVNGSGVSTTGRTLGGATVSITGFPSTLQSSTLAAGKGLLVQTTSAINTYTYHRLLTDEAGVAAAQTLVNDFKSRYQVNGSAPTQQFDGTALEDGDLWFDTGSDVMKVYDGSNYAAVTSVGDYKLLTVVPDGATTGSPVFNGSNVSFDLRDGSSAASITSVGQLLISLNGVLQKPNAGTWSASNEGFHLEGSNGIKFCTAPASGASVFVTQIGSATAVNVPATNSIVEAAIQTNVVSEEKLKISNAPTNGHYLQAQSGVSGGMSWAAVSQYTTPLTTRGDILFRDASGDQRLAKGTAGHYLKMGANDPEWAAVSQYSTPLTTQGDVLYRDGSGDARLAAGTAGQVLTTGGSGANVSWADAASTTLNGCAYENDLTIAAGTYSIAAGKGAHSVGPITNNGTVTVNGRWVIS